MRTTVTALNTLLRRGLAAREPARARRRKFVVEPHSGRFKAGVDPAKLNQLVDQLDVEEFLRFPGLRWRDPLRARKGEARS